MIQFNMHANRIVEVIASSVVGRGFEFRLGQTKTYKNLYMLLLYNEHIFKE